MEERKYKIAALAEDAQRKKERFKMLGMMNQPQDEQDRIKARIEYEQARHDWLVAEAELEKAVQPEPTA